MSHMPDTGREAEFPQPGHMLNWLSVCWYLGSGNTDLVFHESRIRAKPEVFASRLDAA